MSRSTTHKLISQLHTASDHLCSDSFVSSAACDTLIQSLLQQFFVKQGSLFLITSCPVALERSALFFFGPYGPFIKAVYTRSLRSITSYKVPLSTISQLYAELVDINPVLLPHYYHHKMTKSSEGDLVLNILEYTIVTICSAGVNCRVSSKEDNATDKIRLTPYNKLILEYLQALRRQESILYKPLAMEDIQRADDVSMQRSCTISFSPFSSSAFPRTVGDLFISLACDCWFARNIPIGTAEQIVVPLEALKEACQMREVAPDAAPEEKTLHTRALGSVHYRTIAYDCTERPVTDRPCFLTNILDLAYMFSRYVVSPAASLNYGALSTIDNIMESTRRSILADWQTECPPSHTLEASLVAGGRKSIYTPDHAMLQKCSYLYVVRNGSGSILSYFVSTSGISNKLETVAGRNFLRRYAPPFSEIVETRVLPIFFSFLRSLFQGEPVVNKIYLYLLMSRIYGEALCLDPSKLSFDTETYLLDEPAGSPLSMEDERRLRAAIAIRAPFYNALVVEWLRHVASVHIKILSEATSLIDKGALRYGSPLSLFNLRSLYCQNYCKPIQHLAALSSVTRWLSHPFVEPTLSSLGTIASKVTPLDLEVDALLFTARARALMVYAACEPVLWRSTLGKSSAGSRIQGMSPQPYSMNSIKCLVNTEFLKRSITEASQSLLEDLHYICSTISKQYKIAGPRSDPRQGARCYLSIDSTGAPVEATVHKVYPIYTGYIGLLDMTLAHSGEEHLPHDQDRAFFKEYMDQFTKYSSQVKSYLSRLNHSSNITMNSTLLLQSAVFPWERLLLRLAGWRCGVSTLNNVYSISHIYNLLYADMTRGFAGITSSSKSGTLPKRVANQGPRDRPMDIVPSPDYRRLRKVSGSSTALKYAAYCMSNSATKILVNSGLLEDKEGDMSYSMLAGARESTGYTSVVAHPIRPDEFAVLVVVLDAVALWVNYFLSLLVQVLYLIHKSPLLERRLEQGFNLTFRVLANKRLWGLILLVGFMAWLVRLLLL
ncbi:Hypothetical protein GSB_3342 [Giardia duodenalis]|uniref:Uncharacterized protein n=2 Tax=Giardia intestinalis TaxID=5741 RepID=C6LTJ9_GIAIB|nr:Hypothetical protein GL50581_2096 [Giardia intestinalis ATCC 50581]ESU44361.1 Hypothetical protein GSB_3342 [Giardia intestinalis]